MRIWVVDRLISEALARVPEECEEEIALILVLLAHYLVQAFFSEGLHQSLFASHVDTLLLKPVLLVKIGSVAAIDSV